MSSSALRQLRLFLIQEYIMTCTAVSDIEALLNQRHRARAQQHVDGWKQQWGMVPTSQGMSYAAPQSRVAPTQVHTQPADHAKAEKLLKEAYRRQAAKNKKTHDDRMKKRVTIKEPPRGPSRTTPQ